MGKAEELMMANKRQEHTIYKFRTGALNVLVSTSVLEEGIDVKSCNCVIRAFPPDDFRAYIQVLIFLWDLFRDYDHLKEE